MAGEAGRERSDDMRNPCLQTALLADTRTETERVLAGAETERVLARAEELRRGPNRPARWPAFRAWRADPRLRRQPA